MEDIKGKYITDDTLKDILGNVMELLEDQEEGKEKAIEYIESLIQDLD